MLKFNADLFRIVSTCQSKEQTRYYLCGVYVEPCAAGGVTLVATDGHRLMCARDENGTADESAIIQLSPAALKACKTGKGELRREVAVDGSGATVRAVLQDGDSETVQLIAFSTDCRIDGTFPDWRRVVPDPSFAAESRPGAFNGSYLSSFGTIAADLAKLRDSKKSLLRILSSEPESPALVLFPLDPQAFGVIMPCRCDMSTTPPDWLIQTAAEPSESPDLQPAPEPEIAQCSE